MSLPIESSPKRAPVFRDAAMRRWCRLPGSGWRAWASVLLTTVALLGCHAETPAVPADDPSASAPPQPVHAGPFLRAIGTAQDGGFPHAACDHDLCRRARTEPGMRRLVASLALVQPATDTDGATVHLVDATPDIRDQIDALRDVRDPPTDRVDRAPVDGVLLTHAHIGHYLGLAFFGFEAVHTEDLPVYCTPRMAAFLRQHGPWSQLVSLGNLALREHDPGFAFPIGNVEVEMLSVPHRDELSDTVGFLFRGPAKTVLYVPDTNGWHAWREDGSLETLEAVLDRESVDIALLDATFYSLDELPGRDLTNVPHPLIRQTMDLLQSRVDAGTLQVLFTHLNHSNPALDPEGEARREIEQRGFAVLADGQELAL